MRKILFLALAFTLFPLTQAGSWETREVKDIANEVFDDTTGTIKVDVTGGGGALGTVGIIDGSDVRINPAKEDGNLAIIAADTTSIDADTTTIAADTTSIDADTTNILADTTAILADTTAILSDTTAILSDTTGILADTTSIDADTTTIASDTTSIDADTTNILADTTAILSDTTAILSDTTGILADTTSIDTDTSTIAADTTSLDAKIINNGGAEVGAVLVTIANDSTGLVSVDDNGGSLTVDGTVAVSGMPLPAGSATEAKQDVGITSLQAVEGAGNTTVAHLAVIEADTTSIDADTTNILADTTAILADTTGILADTTSIDTDTSTIAADTTSIDADTTNILADTTAILADTTAILADTTSIDTNTSTIAGDTTSIDADTTNILADTTAILADTTAILADTTGILADTTSIDADTTTIAGDTTSIDGKTPALGQANMANSIPVVLASDQSPQTIVSVPTTTTDTILSHYETFAAIGVKQLVVAQGGIAYRIVGYTITTRGGFSNGTLHFTGAGTATNRIDHYDSVSYGGLKEQHSNMGMLGGVNEDISLDIDAIDGSTNVTITIKYIEE